MKIVQIEVSRKQYAVANVAVPDHWDAMRIRRALVCHPLATSLLGNAVVDYYDWQLDDTSRFDCESVDMTAHADPDLPCFVFPDEAPPVNFNQLPLEAA